jgi:AIPR protein
VIKTLLDLGETEALDCMVDGSDDFGVDAIHIGAPRGSEFPVTMVQGKYKRRTDGSSAFPENGVISMLAALGSIFDPDIDVDGNVRLMQRLLVIRRSISEGYLPRVSVILCNNGTRWTAKAQHRIEQSPCGTEATWRHIGPSELVQLLRPAVRIDATLQLSGPATVENFDFRRALVGRIAVGQLATLFKMHGDRLLDRNIRRYIGLAGNRVNEGIASTLRDPQQRQNFYFYNNGITIICDQFRHPALQQQNWHVHLDGLQIINGGQTCRTIQQVVQQLGPEVENAKVMIRIYELPKEDQSLVQNITFATNNQNPVSLRDLKSNDPQQVLLEQSMNELGYKYRRQRSDAPLEAREYEVETVANAVLTVWRRHKKPRTVQSVLDEFYEKVFTSDLNGAQAIIAVRIMHLTIDGLLKKTEKLKEEGENKRKIDGKISLRDYFYWPSLFLPDAEELAVKILEYLLDEFKLNIDTVNHTTFAKMDAFLEQKGIDLFDHAFSALTEEKGIRLSCSFETHIDGSRLMSIDRLLDQFSSLLSSKAKG